MKMSEPSLPFGIRLVNPIYPIVIFDSHYDLLFFLILGLRLSSSIFIYNLSHTSSENKVKLDPQSTSYYQVTVYKDDNECYRGLANLIFIPWKVCKRWEKTTKSKYKNHMNYISLHQNQKKNQQKLWNHYFIARH